VQVGAQQRDEAREGLGKFYLVGAAVSIGVNDSTGCPNWQPTAIRIDAPDD
jgi:hypothetical protein